MGLFWKINAPKLNCRDVTMQKKCQNLGKNHILFCNFWGSDFNNLGHNWSHLPCSLTLDSVTYLFSFQWYTIIKSGYRCLEKNLQSNFWKNLILILRLTKVTSFYFLFCNFWRSSRSTLELVPFDSKFNFASKYVLFEKKLLLDWASGT